MIIIPTETANYIVGHAHSAFVSTRTMSDMEDALICDRGATCTMTKTLENCTQCKPKVVDSEIQTVQGAIIMSTREVPLTARVPVGPRSMWLGHDVPDSSRRGPRPASPVGSAAGGAEWRCAEQLLPGSAPWPATHLCLKTYYVRDRLGEIRPIVVEAYVVSGLKYDLVSVKGLNKCGYAVFHHPDPEKSGVYAVINKKTDKAKSFPFMSEHSSLFYLKLEQISAKQFEKQSGYELWH